MKNYSLLIIILLQGIFVLGQPRKETPTYMPNYTPPSPTVAALMKFEEVPVDNYTGVPNISIPIFSAQAKDKKLGIDINLKYHASAIAVEEIASDVGLGWSLFAGGTVSRVVKDLPDEMLVYEKKVGIYHTTITGSKNNYYDVQDILAHGIQNQTEQNTVDEFMWEANEKKKYDTQHDLWQFNFMGYSGRFYIKKNISTNVLEVVPLEDYNLKIENLYHTTNDYPSNVMYNPEGFIITDTKGYKYYFQEYEVSKNIPFSNDSYNIGPFTVINPNDDLTSKEYRSAFHMTKITDMAGYTLVDFTYSTNFNESTVMSTGTIENTSLSSIIGQIWQSIYMAGPQSICPEGGEASIKKTEPNRREFSNTSTVNAKKISDITIQGVARIHFNFEQGREDFCYNNVNKGCKLKDITIYDWYPDSQLSTVVKKYDFKYAYYQLYNKRLFLKGIDISGKNLAVDNKYEFNYENEGVEPTSLGENLGKDYWGYLNLTSQCAIDPRETSPSACTSMVLQKIKLPTGGCQIFDYEANTYSAIGIDPLPLTDFNSNNDNWLTTDFLEFDMNTTPSVNTVFQDLGLLSGNTTLVFNSTVDDNEALNGFLQVFKYSATSPYTLLNGPDGFYVQGDCPKRLDLDGGYIYKLRFQWNAYGGIGNDPNPNLSQYGHAHVDIDKITRKTASANFLYGGGIRIKRIGYFDKNVDKDYYKNPEFWQYDTPSKEKNYDYSLKSDGSKSSGVLIFPKPLYQYYKTVKTCIDCGNGGNETIPYITKTSFNNLVANKTKGSDIGYQDVTVYESNNGRTEYKYTSSLDAPELGLDYSSDPPFLPYENNDFRRGLLLTQKDFDNTGKPLTCLTNEYDVIAYAQTTGLNLFSRTENALSNSYKYPTFAQFSTIKSICKDSNNLNYNCPPSSDTVAFTPNEALPICPCHCYHGEEVADFINFVPIIENYGWVKLLSTKQQDFFEENSVVKTVEKQQIYSYNALNRKVAEETSSNSLGENVGTKYYYAKDTQMASEPFNSNLITNNIIETPLLTETSNSGSLLSSQKTVYNNWNGLLLPQYIMASKGADALENKVRLNRYDAYGKPLEVQQENGMPISYIWGYNDTQPIAKIENVAYTSISASLISAAQTASNNSVTGLESNLMTALSNLRASLPNAMITTYTYIPLIGISTITDPKGDRQTFTYDAMGRLSAVKDKNGNILSENEYHYKN